MANKIKLNFNVYPLVVGQEDKFTFSNWQREGGSIQLTAALSGSDYTEQDITWNSTDPSVAQVEDGLVHALTVGIVDITATLPDGSFDCCRIQVIDNIARLTAAHVTLNADRLILSKLEGAQLYPHIMPVDYFENGMLDDTFTWSSSNEDAVVVNHRARVWAKECGTAVITGISNDVGRKVSCEVTVVKKTEEEMYKDPLEDLEGGSVTMKIAAKKTLLLPEEVMDQPVFWRSDNAAIASVDVDGTVHAYRSGTVSVWATFLNGGHRVHYQVEVERLPSHSITEIQLNKKELDLAAGERSAIYAVVFPATLLEAQMEWKSSNPQALKIVKQHINLSGLDEVIVEARAEGTSILTAKRDGFTVSCAVTVAKARNPLTQINMPEEQTIEPQQIIKLSPCFNKGAKGDVLWLSDCACAATVDREGTVKGYSAGEALIYCIAANSLTTKAREQIKEISAQSSIRDDKKQAEKLQALLDSSIYGECRVKVTEENNCLTNLHIPEETVTAASVCLLWNRASLIDTGKFSYYKIYVNQKEYMRTEKLSCTVKNLEPNAQYSFDVAAFDNDDRELCRKNALAKTKEAPAVIDVTKAPYAAVGDGIATDTYAIQRAIDDCPRNGTVLLPAGFVFYSGALFLKSDMTFQIEGILFGSLDPADYPPIVCRWEGYRKLRLTEENQKCTTPVFDENVYSHASLINVGVYDEGEAGKLSPYHTFNVKICGHGMINGNGFSLSYNEGPCWYTLRKGLPIPHSPMRDQNIRGRVIAMYNVKGAYVADLTVAYGPSWTIHPVFSDSVTFDNLKVITMGNGRTGAMEGMLILNGDGIDPDSCTNINILDSYFTVGDDAVAIKSGRNREGNELDKPSAYIRVTDCVCVDAKGSYCIGSEQSGGVHDVLFQNLRAESLLHFGLWIKSAPFRGGLVEHIAMRDCLLKDTGGALQIEYQHGGDENPALELPMTRHVQYENICFAGKNKFGIRLIGHEDSPITDVSFRGCRFMEDFVAKKEPHFKIAQCKEISITDSELPSQYQWENED